MHLTLSQARELGIDVDRYLGDTGRGAPPLIPLPVADTAPRYPSVASNDGMNKLERKFSHELEALYRSDRIKKWDFEPVKLRLAGRCWYSPDFRIVKVDGTILFCETKGGYAREDSLIKLKTASVIHDCFKFKLITNDRKSGWLCRDVTRTGFGPLHTWEI